MMDVGEEYLAALAAAQEARQAYKTNGGDNYDPCGDTKRRVSAEYDEAIRRLARATSALTKLGEHA